MTEQKGTYFLLITCFLLWIVWNSDCLVAETVPVVSCMTRENETGVWLFRKQLNELLPFFDYALEHKKEFQGKGEGQKNFGNEEKNEGKQEQPKEVRKDTSNASERLFEPVEETDGDTRFLEEMMREEREDSLGIFQQADYFTPHNQKVQLDLEALKDYDTLMKEFYVVDSNTMVGQNQLNVEKLLNQDLTIDLNGEGPQILIYHTHSQEAFADSFPGDPGTSIVGVGERLATLLEDNYGYRVLHFKGVFDLDTRDDAYSKALPEIESLLKEYPSICVVIDLHRDEMPEDTKLVMDLDGRPTARFMFFNGLSRTKKTGNIAYLKNENQDSNLAFSFQMQKKAYEYYPGLTRKIYLKGYRYNMHLKPRYLLVELGAQNNTVTEAMNACDPLAHLLHLVLSSD